MLAKQQVHPAATYVSDRVFDGVRRPSDAMVSRINANYQRTHTTRVTKFVWIRSTARHLFAFFAR